LEEEGAQLLAPAVDAAPPDLDLAVVGEQLDGLLPHAVVQVIAVDALQALDRGRALQDLHARVQRAQLSFEVLDAHGPDRSRAARANPTRSRVGIP
jgi:hypothetical protein